jgi:type I restriction enzyme S subunit
MTSSMQSYPEYKASGVPWLGDVPAHWQVLPNRAILSETNNRDFADEAMLSVTIANGIVLQRSILEDSSKKDGSREDKSTYKLVEPGDIAYNKMRAWQGAIGVSDYRGIVSPAYVVQRPRSHANSRYLHYMLRTPAFAGEAERWSYGITSDMWSLRSEHFKMIYCCLPPLDEQQAIVRYLDAIDRRVRRYIRAKQRLLALLREQKQAIIHQAVTRGLDASAPLKPSGVAWLGEVPAHWEVWQIGHFAKVGNGSTPSRSNPDYWNRGEFPWLNSASVNHGRITASDQYVTNLALKECHLPIVRPGSILIAITGQGKTRGTAALLETEATINQHIAFVTPMTSRVLPDYLLLFLRAAYADLRRISDDAGGTKGALTCEDIKRYRVLVPPLREQRSLVETVSHQTGHIDFVMHRTQREIALIQEYRTRLIADVVTGKVDVRAAAVALPAEVGEEVAWAVGEGEEEGEEVSEEELQRMQTGNG